MKILVGMSMINYKELLSENLTTSVNICKVCNLQLSVVYLVAQEGGSKLNFNVLACIRTHTTFRHTDCLLNETNFFLSWSRLEVKTFILHPLIFRPFHLNMATDLSKLPILTSQGSTRLDRFFRP